MMVAINFRQRLVAAAIPIGIFTPLAACCLSLGAPERITISIAFILSLLAPPACLTFFALVGHQGGAANLHVTHFTDTGRRASRSKPWDLLVVLMRPFLARQASPPTSPMFEEKELTPSEEPSDKRRAAEMMRQISLQARRARWVNERSRAKTMGKIADLLQSHGDLEEALRIWREDERPVYEQLGDERSRAVMMGELANALQMRGDLDEALRIRRAELSAYERLGDVLSCAETTGRIADTLEALGNLEEALRIRRDEELPVYARLNLPTDLLMGQTKLASTYLARGRDNDRQAAKILLTTAFLAASKLRSPFAKVIFSLLSQVEKSNTHSTPAVGKKRQD